MALAIAFPACAGADWAGDRSAGHSASPVYQRRAFEWRHGGDRHGRGRGGAWSPRVSAGWFQRPYPYHLDYYRMRYGGSYAPYFGNLYGPPQVVTAPPYYGPYYGGYGDPNGFAHQGGYGPPTEHPVDANGIVYEGPIQAPRSSDPPAPRPNGEGLPAPAP